MKILLSSVVACGLMGPAFAHPHIFVETGLVLVLDGENRVTEIRLERAYDELYSLLILADYGADADGDGILSGEDMALLKGFDLAYPESPEGDLFLYREGLTVALDTPVAMGVALEDGMIVTANVRVPAAPVPVGKALTLMAYDPTYYAAYTMAGGVTFEGGTGCKAHIAPADLNAAYDLVEEMLYGPGARDYDEDSYPEVGAAFADRVTVTCAAES